MGTVDEVSADQRECNSVTSLGGVAQTQLKHPVEESAAMAVNKVRYNKLRLVLNLTDSGNSSNFVTQVQET